MLTRRSLLAGGIAGGTLSGAAEGRKLEAGQSSRGGGNTDEALVKAVEDIRELIRADAGGSSAEVNTLRSLQREFLKGRSKFPDFIDVGIDVWDAVINWHIRTRQQPQVTRTSEGRYSLALFQTNLVLRPELGNSYIGQPYDAK